MAPQPVQLGCHRSPAGLPAFRSIAANSRRRRRFTLALATDADRQEIYALRHQVYAAELGQHHTNDAGQLRHALDEVNLFIVARVDGRVIGCVSVTPPQAGRFSLDKYVERTQLPFAFDATVFEARW